MEDMEKENITDTPQVAEPTPTPSNRYKIPVIAECIVFLLLFFITMLVSGIAAEIIIPTTDGQDMDYLFLYTILSSILSFAVIALMQRGVNREPLSGLGFRRAKSPAECLLIGIGVPTAIFLVNFAVNWLAGSVRIEGVQWAPADLMLSLLFFIPAAFVEEIWMRGYLLNILLRTHMPSWLSILIMSLVFAAVHLANPGINLLSVVNLTVAGILLGVLFVYTRNLLYPLVFHFAWNWLQGSVFGFKVSGTDYFSSVIQLQLTRDDLLNGGSFGFEGSVLCTLLASLAIAGLAIYFKATASPPAGHIHPK